jgi:hypothetical protein
MNRFALSEVTKSRSGSASLPSFSQMIVSWKTEVQEQRTDKYEFNRYA